MNSVRTKKINNPQAQLQFLNEAFFRETRAAKQALDIRRKHLTTANGLHAEIQQYEIEIKSTNRRRRIANQKLANSIYRDGAPRVSAGHAEIVRRYAWGAQERRAPRRRGSNGLVALLRLRQLERIISARYRGTLPGPDDDGGAEDLWIAAQLIRQLGGSIATKISDWARLWAPWCPAQEAEQLAAHVIKRPYKFSADMLAQKLGLTYAERLALGITAIGAIDADLKERTRLRKQRSRAAEKERRRANGARPREIYVGGSANSERPWEAEGISRRTWYRRRQQARVSTVQKEPARVSEGRVSQPSTNRELVSSHGSLGDGFDVEISIERPRGTSLRLAGFGEAEADRTPMPIASRAAVDASIGLSPPCGHVRSPCARSRYATQPADLEPGLGVSQNRNHHDLARLEVAYEKWLAALSERERRRILKRLFNPTRRDKRTRRRIDRLLGSWSAPNDDDEMSTRGLA